MNKRGHRSSLRFFRLAHKRGISTIVATVLIVLVTVASVSILWVAALPLIQQVTFVEDPSVQVKIEPGVYTAFDEDHNLMSIRVSRGADDAVITAIKFVLTELSGSTFEYVTEDIVEPNSAKVYEFGIDYYDNITEISVLPVYEISGREIESVNKDTFENMPEKNLSGQVTNPVAFHDYYRSCKQIYDQGASSGDAYYLIDPDGPGGYPAASVFCNMSDGGWTRIDYASDEPFTNKWGADVDIWRLLDQNFTTVLSSEQIRGIQAVSTEGRQIYNGSCSHVIHYWYTYATGSDYNYAFGYFFLDGTSTARGTQNLGVTFTVLQDDCHFNAVGQNYTAIEINDVRVPIVNVWSRDSGNSGEFFGSLLTNHPAWLR